MSKHTPAPWFIGKALRGAQYCIVGDGNSVVALMPDESIFCTYKPADAALIAAAPDLLAALIDLAGAGGEAWGNDRPCVREALYAIAKATGEA